jgi:hypothetical protein
MSEFTCGAVGNDTAKYKDQLLFDFSATQEAKPFEVQEAKPFELQPIFEFSVFIRGAEGDVYSQSVSTRNVAEFARLLRALVENISRKVEPQAKAANSLW